MSKQDTGFDCVKCGKNLKLSEEIYKKAYEGHELCLSCRSEKKESDCMKLVDEQRQLYRTAFLGGYLKKWEFDSILSSEQAWKEEAEQQKQEKYQLQSQLRQVVDALERATSKERGAQIALLTGENERLKSELNQAKGVLKWIRDAGTDYQSINKARDFLSSLSQKEETA